MAISVEERIDSRTETTGENASAVLAYVIRGSDDAAAIRAALSAHVADTYGGLVLDRLEIEPLHVNGDQSIWDGRAHYVAPERAPQTGDETFEFDTAGGTQHITQSLATVDSDAESGAVPILNGAIGVTHDSVEGVDIQTRAFAFSVTKYIAAADMDPTYVAALYGLTGKVNSDAWSIEVDGVVLEFQPGEVLFLGASGSKRGKGDWVLSLKFAASPNATGLTIGSMSVNKKGWEYLWVMYEDAIEQNIKVQVPAVVYVEQVYETGDFSGLRVSALMEE